MSSEQVNNEKVQYRVYCDCCGSRNLETRMHYVRDGEHTGIYTTYCGECKEKIQEKLV